MAMGKRKRHRQPPLWVETARLAKGPSHPFYRRLNQILGQHGFDEFVERTCQRFYSERGSAAPPWRRRCTSGCC